MKSKLIPILIIGFLVAVNIEIKRDPTSYPEINNLNLSATSIRIHIKDNWTDFKSVGICIGEGTNSDPYIIEDLIIDGGGNGYCILIENSTVNFIIKNCTISNGGSNFDDAGIKMVNVSNGQLRDNDVVSNCYYSFNLDNCENNLIVGNIFTTFGAIRFTDSSNNRMYMNDIDSSSISMYFGPDSNNFYSSSSRITYIYEGNTFTNYLGNYWSEYDGNDGNNDGVGDTPVEFTDTNSYIVDNYPLMAPIDNYEITSLEIPGYNIGLLIGLISFILLLTSFRVKKKLK